MLAVYKFRSYLDKKRYKILSRYFNLNKVLWNKILGLREIYCKKNKKYKSKYELNYYSTVKFLKEPDKSCKSVGSFIGGHHQIWIQ